MKVPFLDLRAQYREIEPAVSRALKALWSRSDYILGEDVRAFEEEFARYLGLKFALGVNSGTDALFLGLLSLGVGPGDEVLVPAYTYIASAFAVTYTGARPVFVDIEDATFNIDPGRLEKAITKNTKAVMPVHLYGQAADMDPILEVARRHGLRVIEDAAQAHGTLYKGRKAGALGDLGAYSFYPTKNMGAFGDAGMVVTDDAPLYEKLKKLRDYGRTSRYEHDSVGYNSRLDSMQAVFLREKLRRLDLWNEKRRGAAERYRRGLKDAADIRLPEEAPHGGHVYHIFAVRLKKRESALKRLRDAGVGAMVHYPVPLHLQAVYASLGYKQGDFPIAERICREVLCLPIFPHIKDKEIDYVIKVLTQEEKG